MRLLDHLTVMIGLPGVFALMLSGFSFPVVAVHLGSMNLFVAIFLMFCECFGIKLIYDMVK